MEKNMDMVSSRTKIKVSTGYRVFQVCNTILMILVCVITLYPFLYLVAQSFSSESAIVQGLVKVWPVEFNLTTYKSVISKGDFIRYYGNTIFYAVIGTVGSLLFSAMLAYPLSKPELRLNKIAAPLIIFTMYFGGGMVPYYMVLKSLGMLNNFIVFIFPNLVSVYNMILVKNYIEGMPAEIFESAKIDGANDLTVFFKMVIPLSKPIIMTIALFVAITHWNSWFDAYLFTNAQSLKTMQSILVEILNQYQTASANQAAKTITPDSIRMAATMIATIPIIMVYPFIQKYFVKGIMLGSVKS